jgi:hypothetical protein
MSKGHFDTTLVIHSCPAAGLDAINLKLSEFNLSVTWSPQTCVVGSSCGEIRFKSSSKQLDEMAASLWQLGMLHFELIQNTKYSGVTYMFVPGLGLFRGELNESGALTLTEDKLQSLLDRSAGNHREFTRLLRLALGQSWHDILEPFRAAKYTDNVVLLNRAG